jgi:hypothetical protein
MIGLFCFVLAVLGLPFKSKLRLEAENAVVCTENLKSDHSGIGGPLLIGALLAYQLSAASLFYAAAGPMLLAGILVMLLGSKYKTP